MLASGMLAVCLVFAPGFARGDEAGEHARLLSLLRESSGDAVVFDPPRAGAATLRMAARVRASVDGVMAVLKDPSAYRRAVPAFVRADVLRTEGADRLLAWELEIPLWNLAGKLWMRARPDGVELELAEGDMTPGKLRLRALPGGSRPDSDTVLVIEGAVNMRQANWVTRRLAARDPLAEPAMTATAVFVLLRALALEAGGGGTRWPRGPMRAPPAEQLQAADLAGRMAVSPGRAGSALAVVRTRGDGRLDVVQVALASPLDAATLQARLSEVQRWRGLPGWKSVAAKDAGGGKSVWEVDSSFPFVDFDAEWTVRETRPLRLSADGGDWRGPVMGWDVAGKGSGATAALSLHPRLELTGYLPRKLIEAEPLLEQGLALGLAYVNAVSLLRAANKP